MASVSDEPSSASPKRIKLDDTVSRHKMNEDTSLSRFGLPHETIEQETPEPLSFSLAQKFEHFTGIELPEDELTHLEADSDNLENKDDDEDEDDDDDVSSTVSNVSDLSGLSDMSGHQWKPIANEIDIMSWIDKQVTKGISPRLVYRQITGRTTPLPETITDVTIWKAIYNLLVEPPRRARLPNITSLDDVVHLLKTCSKIIVLTGAGVSVSCGIPDFRSKDGVYARLSVDFPDLPDPQAMFDINYFCQDPRPFFKFAREIYPGQFKPSPCHRFIRMLEIQKKLLRNYTQNIDTLEKVAEIENVVECHGSFATASCTYCHYKVSAEDIREDVFKQQIPYCFHCTPPVADGSRGVMKPDIVFFGEGLPEKFHDAMGKDKDECDLLIVIGSSLKVRPVALIPSSLPSHVPQILINRERLPHMNFDVELLGDSDIIIDQLCYMLGQDWEEIRWKGAPLKDSTDLVPILDNGSDSSYSSSDKSDNDSDTSEIKCQRIGRRVAEGDENSRHMSLDSSLSRDSGIGDSSNSSNERSPSPAASAVDIAYNKDSYFQYKKRKYIFPGAEVTRHHICGTSSN